MLAAWCCVGALLLCGSPVPASRMQNVVGPYRIVPDHIESCPAKSSSPMVLLSPPRGIRDRIDRNLWYYSVNTSLPFTFDNSIDLDINWASWSSRGGWKDNAILMRPGSVCKFVPANVPDAWRRFLIATFNDPTRDCPFPPGNYEIKNMSSEVTFKKIPAFFYGTWRVTIRLLQMKDDKFCVRFYGKTIPK
ncbi:Unconventional myosin-Ie [Frankliniella fusca]|uniref:Unconventional myosin-Ie n=1 Tax=Frankliniella fusca TaxID=407009 RepID=A0AAE1HQ04_9NEOP|nr:Unconventional myosin-Ie [Frankliniella fusca]